MADNIFPAFALPEGQEESDTSHSAIYNNSPLWDYAKGDFVYDDANRIAFGSGYDAWVLWCNKNVRTERLTCLAYSALIGVEAEDVFSLPDRDAAEIELERNITEAVLADPCRRSASVHSFEFTWRADSLHVSCVVTSSQGEEALVTVGYKI